MSSFKKLNKDFTTTDLLIVERAKMALTAIFVEGDTEGVELLHFTLISKQEVGAGIWSYRFKCQARVQGKILLVRDGEISVFYSRATDSIKMRIGLDAENLLSFKVSFFKSGDNELEDESIQVKFTPPGEKQAQLIAEVRGANK